MVSVRRFFSSEGWEASWQAFKDATRRFPLTLMVAFAGYLFVNQLIDYGNTHTTEPPVWLQKAAVTGIIGISVFFGLELLGERRNLNKWWQLAIGLLILGGFYFLSRPTEANVPTPQFVLQAALLFVASHLLVAVLPYWKHPSITEFWHYNKTLFLHILTAFLYAVTLLIGLLLALTGIGKLFEVNIPNKLYMYLWTTLLILFSTAFFTSKFPSFQRIERDDSYPIGLKYFTQYVLLPLVAIYLLILLAYELKIVFAWQLPKGWVSLMVLASAIFGILAFLLLYPLRTANKWVQQYTRGYYWLLLPLVALMAAAIYIRVQQYGFTEERYLVALLTVWLLGICLYFVISKVDDIRYIPLSLAVVALVAGFLPWGNMFAVSEANQLQRLKQVVSKENWLKEEKILIPKNAKVDAKTNDKLHAAVEFLAKSNPQVLASYLPAAAADSLLKTPVYQRANTAAALLQLPTKTLNENVLGFTAARSGSTAEPLYRADYRLMLHGSFNDKILLEGKEMQISCDTSRIRITPNGEAPWEIPLQQVKALKGEVPLQQVTFFHADNSWNYRLVFMQGTFADNGHAFYDAHLYLTKK